MADPVAQISSTMMIQPLDESIPSAGAIKETVSVYIAPYMATTVPTVKFVPHVSGSDDTDIIHLNFDLKN